MSNKFADDENDPITAIDVVVITSGADFHTLEPEQRDYLIVEHPSGGATLVVSPGGYLESIECFDCVKDAVDALRKLCEVELCGDFD